MVAALAPTDMPTASWEDGALRREADRNSLVYARALGSADLSWRPPDGWKGLAKRLAYLGQLGVNWDSYGGGPIDAAVVDFTGSLLQSLAPWAVIGVPAPALVPTHHGGIQLEWHCGDTDLEIEVAAPYKIHVLFANDAAGQEEEFTLGADISKLLPFLARVASSSAATGQ